MKRGGWLLVVVLVLVLTVGGVEVVKLVRNDLTVHQQLRSNLRAAAVEQGVDPDIVDAIAYVESRWKADLLRSEQNLTGPDGARGGSYGPTQISQKTARAYGFTGDMLELCSPDGVLAGYWTARILASRPGGCGPGTSIADAAAWWNAGRARAELVPAGNSALKYIPQAVAALDRVRSSPPPAEYTEVAEA